jgi:hypothetical protein
VATTEGLVEVLPVVHVRIEADDLGFYLFRFDESGQMVADTWHQSLEEAKDQARFEYMIADDDWTVATDPDHSGPHNPGAVTSI